MEFTWKLEDLKLRGKNYKDFEQMAESMTTEELEKAIDEYSHNKYSTSFYKEMRERFQNDVKNNVIKRGTYGSFNMNSLKSWRKKNGLSTSYCYDYELEGLGFVGYRNHMSFKYNDEQMRNGWEYTFVKTCESLKSKEEQYFAEHDEYTILTREVNELCDKFRFAHLPDGCKIWFGSNITIVDEDAEGCRLGQRNLTIEELKTLKDYYLGLQKVMEEYEKAHEIHFTF